MARRKPRLFAFPREVELAHLQEWSTDPDQVRLVTQVIDAFALIAKTKQVEAGQLVPFLQAARHTDPQVRGLGLTRLSVLCHYFEEARLKYAELTTDPSPDVRSFAVTLLANTPRTLIDALLPAALQDDDESVRAAAGAVAKAVQASTT